MIDGSVPDGDQKVAVYEILRVAANLCMDHSTFIFPRPDAPWRRSSTNLFTDENRDALLESGFPQTVVTVLEGYAEKVEPANLSPLPLSLPDLRIVKTSIGVLLNLSVGYGK